MYLATSAAISSARAPAAPAAERPPSHYSLTELDAALPKYQPAGVERASGIGRNVDLFARAVSEAHRPSWQPVFASEGYGGRWLAHIEHLNDELHANYPLPKSECRSIAKSAMGYAIRQFSAESFSALQTQRNGKRWHGKFDFDFAARDGWIVHMKKEGLSNAQVAKFVGLHKSQVGRVLKKKSRQKP